jgi:anti-anti-sigma factor
VNSVDFTAYAGPARRVLVARGELDMASTGPYEQRFTAEARGLRPGAEFVLDLGAVSFFDSCALRATLACVHAAEQSGLIVHVVASEAVGRVLDAAGVGPDLLRVVRLKAPREYADTTRTG